MEKFINSVFNNWNQERHIFNILIIFLSMPYVNAVKGIPILDFSMAIRYDSYSAIRQAPMEHSISIIANVKKIISMVLAPMDEVSLQYSMILIC